MPETTVDSQSGWDAAEENLDNQSNGTENEGSSFDDVIVTPDPSIDNSTEANEPEGAEDVETDEGQGQPEPSFDIAALNSQFGTEFKDVDSFSESYRTLQERAGEAEKLKSQYENNRYSSPMAKAIDGMHEAGYGEADIQFYLDVLKKGGPEKIDSHQLYAEQLILSNPNITKTQALTLARSNYPTKLEQFQEEDEDGELVWIDGYDKKSAELEILKSGIDLNKEIAPFKEQFNSRFKEIQEAQNPEVRRTKLNNLTQSWVQVFDKAVPVQSAYKAKLGDVDFDFSIPLEQVPVLKQQALNHLVGAGKEVTPQNMEYATEYMKSVYLMNNIDKLVKSVHENALNNGKKKAFLKGGTGGSKSEKTKAPKNTPTKTKSGGSMSRTSTFNWGL